MRAWQSKRASVNLHIEGRKYPRDYHIPFYITSSDLKTLPKRRRYFALLGPGPGKFDNGTRCFCSPLRREDRGGVDAREVHNSEDFYMATELGVPPEGSFEQAFHLGRLVRSNPLVGSFVPLMIHGRNLGLRKAVTGEEPGRHFDESNLRESRGSRGIHEREINPSATWGGGSRIIHHRLHDH